MACGIRRAQACPDLVKMPLKLFISFKTTYECETAFSILLGIKI